MANSVPGVTISNAYRIHARTGKYLGVVWKDWQTSQNVWRNDKCAERFVARTEAIEYLRTTTSASRTATDQPTTARRQTTMTTDQYKADTRKRQAGAMVDLITELKGKLDDRFGPRRVVMVSTSLCALLCLLIVIALASGSSSSNGSSSSSDSGRSDSGSQTASIEVSDTGPMVGQYLGTGPQGVGAMVDASMSQLTTSAGGAGIKSQTTCNQEQAPIGVTYRFRCTLNLYYSDNTQAAQSVDVFDTNSSGIVIESGSKNIYTNIPSN